jgi:2-succinyl-5-enolpyruvyl-6-hydroxy-3-cyclohexene-1-carboxylate synthase
MTATVDTYRMLRAFVDELARCGMGEACTSPGSRNTPIVLSLVREPRLRCFSHIDERCAGFFAVGAAKASGRPVAVTCTSGTAAAELVPAVVEAHWARVPLLVLTADRPAELRDVGAGQAIDQLKLYGDAAKWFCEVELPPVLDAGAMRWIRRLACRAYWTALEGRPGPVHLNLPLREPLVLDAPLPAEPPELAGRPHHAPWVTREAGGPHRILAPAPARAIDARTLIVAGRVESDPRLAVAIADCAQRLGAPVLADPLSGARSGPQAIATYDLLLRDPELAAPLTPELVIRVGDLPTSKPLRAWLAGLGPAVHQVVLDPHAAWQDPDAVANEMWTGDPLAVLPALTAPGRPPGSSWLEAWLDADAVTAAALRDGLGSELSEPRVAAALGEWLEPRTTVFAASSMVIRDLELYLPAGTPLPRVLCNRGANGIDGTISSAFGAAAAGGPVVLLIGDVALLHDLGGLLAARRLGLELTIVVLNNDGGGIFNFLPVSGAGAAFETHIATPHGLSLERVAALFELGYERPGSLAELERAVRGGAGSGGVTLLEVRTDRTENVALHRRLAERALAAVRTR